MQMRESAIDILLLEDNPDHQELFRAHLDLTGFAHARVEYASTMQRGMALLRSESFDLVFLDLSLPDSTIEASLEKIALLSKECPVVVLTSLDDKQTIMSVIDRGAEDCLPKLELNDLLLERTIRFSIDRWRLRQKLQQSEQKYLDLYDNSPDMYVSVNAADGSIRTCNKTLADKLDYSTEEIGRMKIFELYHPDCMQKVKAAFKSFVETGEVHNAELQLKRRDGSRIDVILNVSAVRDEHGEIVFSRSCWRDVSEQKRVEARVKLLLDSTAEGIYGLDLDGNCTFANKQCASLLGYASVDELIGQNIHQLIHHTRKDGKPYPVSECRACQAIRTEQDTFVAGEIMWRKDRSSFPSEYSSIPVFEEGKLIGSVVTFSDITRRKLAEAEIRLYSRAMAQSGEAILIADLNGVIEHVNPAFTVITGYTEDEVIGKRPNLLKSGNQHSEFYARLWGTIRAGETWQGKITNRKKNGDLYPAMLTISPIKDETGKTVNYIGVQQNLEKFEELEAQFHQSQKMEAIGTLVGGIAHDFNNNLAGITGNLYLAKKAAAAIPEVVKRLESVEKLSFSAAATIQQLLTFSRKGIVQMNPISISAFLKETIKLNQVSLPENINLKLQVIDPDLRVKGDINQLQQVLMNLINNAYDAVSESENPAIQVRLERFIADDRFNDKYEGKIEREFARISVTDNGSGISAEDIDHIFEPFFTTKEPGRGTGLGLAMVYGAVKTHGGAVEVKSPCTDERGTRIDVYLPLLESEQTVALSELNDKVLQGHGETILLVDDNEIVLSTGCDVLEGMGYRVMTAEDGREAVEVYQEHGDKIDIVILDVVMPRLSGPEALDAIKAINPKVKAMFATGYDKLSMLGREKSEIEEKVISKPFAISVLSQAISELLQG